MKIEELSLNGLYKIILHPNNDSRGFFMRTYDSELFSRYGLCQNWAQENHSRSNKKGIIRGLHFQLEPFAETKLIRCIRGSIYDVVVDMRRNSHTLGKWEGIELSEENKTMLYIPPGFAHGYYTLAGICEIVYKVDNYYSPDHEVGIKWNDSDLSIDWPGTSPVLSEKDKNNMTFKEFLRM
ncbi:MAG: dTDP-4-dehydrorhamnose 3,5-epimerase [Bacteroidales bacterium]|nr:dTDP-4-dehydrorhamnose 3,5-epimerase [Bacteroidales bacterium]